MMATLETVFCAVVMIGLIVMACLAFIFAIGLAVIAAIEYVKEHIKDKEGKHENNGTI